MGDLPQANGDPFLPCSARSDAERAPSGGGVCHADNYYADGEISVLRHSFTTSGYASPFWSGSAMPPIPGANRGYPVGTVRR